MKGSVIPLEGRRRTATPMLMIAWMAKTVTSPVPASLMKGSRSRISRHRERSTITA